MDQFKSVRVVDQKLAPILSYLQTDEFVLNST